VAGRLLRLRRRPGRVRASGRRVPRRGVGAARRNDFVPIAFVGVPPIVSGLHGCFEEAAPGRADEVQRQFAMPGTTASLVEQYLAYTYPYSVFERLSDIKAEAARRGVRGIVHYVQSFCFRQIEDILLRKRSGACPHAGGRRSRPGGRPDEDPDQAFVEMLQGAKCCVS